MANTNNVAKGFDVLLAHITGKAKKETTTKIPTSFSGLLGKGKYMGKAEHLQKVASLILALLEQGDACYETGFSSLVSYKFVTDGLTVKVKGMDNYIKLNNISRAVLADAIASIMSDTDKKAFNAYLKADDTKKLPLSIVEDNGRKLAETLLNKTDLDNKTKKSYLAIL